METRVVDLTDFIDLAIALAESIEQDIRSGDKISSETVLCLSRFVTISEPVLTAMVAALPDKNSMQ